MDIPFDPTLFQSEHFLIPFLFILAVTFGAVNASKAFKNRGVNFLISLALSLFAASNSDFVELLWSQFGNVTIFFIAMFFIIFTLEAFGARKKPGEKGDGADALVIYGAILFVLFSLGYLWTNALPSIPVIGGGQNLILFIFIIFILAIFWSAYKTSGGNAH